MSNSQTGSMARIMETSREDESTSETGETRSTFLRWFNRPRTRFWRYTTSVFLVVLATLVGLPIHLILEPANLVMLYLAAVVLVAKGDLRVYPPIEINPMSMILRRRQHQLAPLQRILVGDGSQSPLRHLLQAGNVGAVNARMGRFER